MNILIIGANGQIGMRLTKKLQESKYTPIAMVRKKHQVAKFEEQGVKAILADLEEDISHAFENANAVVFTAGSGAHTPKSQTKVIDQNGAKKAIDEAKKAGIDRFIMVSALLANRDPQNWSEPMKHYYEAKSNADSYLRKSGLAYTILMPGRLKNEEGSGKVELSEKIEDPESRSITREDVASVIVQAIEAKNTFNRSLDLLQGQTPIPKAVSEID
ncbi:SDR family oxidoreductase [Gracilimonas tropica]|uniref:SDR family oxidoreductase n=1 Tax=Gracilimonas tropica TaxID=454600 RepID=UPI000476CDF7|nr:SDR family oxidoreductase [Gracilimonas tropica]